MVTAQQWKLVCAARAWTLSTTVSISDNHEPDVVVDLGRAGL
jgi:hypothetical protein